VPSTETTLWHANKDQGPRANSSAKWHRKALHYLQKMRQPTFSNETTPCEDNPNKKIVGMIIAQNKIPLMMLPSTYVSITKIKKISNNTLKKHLAKKACASIPNWIFHSIVPKDDTHFMGQGRLVLNMNITENHKKIIPMV
ncbi:hypothetical protein ACJX0J_033411, partial [Zea mays]